MDINQKMYELGNKRSIIRELFEYGKVRSQQIGAENVFDFSLGNPSVTPPKEISEVIKSLLDTENSVYLHGYTSAQGDFNTRKAIANKISSDYNLNITPNNIYMTCGAAASISISLKALLNCGDEVIVFAPFFTEYRVFIENAGGKIIVSTPQEDTFQIDLNDFESKITPNTKAVIINSPNNPSGVVYTNNCIENACKILNKKQKEFGKNIYIIADEPYRELIYSDVNVPYLMNYYDNTLVCYSYSKSLSLPGERIGYIAVNPASCESEKVYLSICGAGRSLGYVCAPSLFQHVIEKCVNLTIDTSVYKENRDILLENLTSYGYKCVKPDGAFYLFVKSPEPNAVAFAEKAKKFDIIVVPCDDFGVKGYVRIAYCVEKSKITRSLPSFKRLIDSYR